MKTLNDLVYEHLNTFSPADNDFQNAIRITAGKSFIEGYKAAICNAVEFLKDKLYLFEHNEYGLYEDTTTTYLTSDYETVDEFVNDFDEIMNK